MQNKPELGWRSKTRRERRVPLADELVEVLRRVIGDRRAGPLFLRPKLAEPMLHNRDSAALARVAERRVAEAEAAAGEPIPRTADDSGFYAAAGAFLAALIPAERAVLNVPATSQAVTPSAAEGPDLCEGCELAR